MYYGYRCYNKDGEHLGWLYTYNNDTELVATHRYLSWCKRWKTERGAKKNFDRYNNRWQQLGRGYLKIEVMPDIEEPESAESRASKLLEEWGDNVTSSSSNTNLNPPLLSNKMFKNQEYMTNAQRTITEDFMKMVEAEYALCVSEIKRANSAVILSEESNNDRHLDLANREIDSINKYWQIRLMNLIEFIETKNHKLNKELSTKYLNH